jgi:SAM-dependent methyltransferase
MTIDLIRDVNAHFTPFYPWIARQIADAWPHPAARTLEIGPYAGNAFALLELRPELTITMGDDDPQILAYLDEWAAGAGLRDRVSIQPLDKYALPQDGQSVDLVIFRGGLFFWDHQDLILAEAWRVLAPGGVAFIGGGFGAGAPDALIEQHLPEARRLNEALGKARLSTRQLQGHIDAAGLAPFTTIDHRHGLWAVLRRPA